MPIAFRTQRVATSVVNRILNVAEGIFPKPTPGQLNAPGALPEGAQLDAQIGTPKAPVDADPNTASAIALGPLAK
jgi:hypothetical protein